MVNYQSLLEKYDKDYVKGEKRTSTCEIQREYNQKRRYYVVESLFKECEDFTDLCLDQSQKSIVHGLVNKFSHCFGDLLHHNISEETIILAFIFYQLLLGNSSIRINDYTVFNKHRLTYNVYSLIISRTLQHYMQNTPTNLLELKKFRPKVY